MILVTLIDLIMQYAATTDKPSNAVSFGVLILAITFDSLQAHLNHYLPSDRGVLPLRPRQDASCWTRRTTLRGSSARNVGSKRLCHTHAWASHLVRKARITLLDDERLLSSLRGNGIRLTPGSGNLRLVDGLGGMVHVQPHRSE